MLIGSPTLLELLRAYEIVKKTIDAISTNHRWATYTMCRPPTTRGEEIVSLYHHISYIQTYLKANRESTMRPLPARPASSGHVAEEKAFVTAEGGVAFHEV